MADTRLLNKDSLITRYSREQTLGRCQIKTTTFVLVGDLLNPGPLAEWVKRVKGESLTGWSSLIEVMQPYLVHSERKMRYHETTKDWLSTKSIERLDVLFVDTMREVHLRPVWLGKTFSYPALNFVESSLIPCWKELQSLGKFVVISQNGSNAWRSMVSNAVSRGPNLVRSPDVFRVSKLKSFHGLQIFG